MESLTPKEAAVLRDDLIAPAGTDPNEYSRHVLPPGTYRLVMKAYAPDIAADKRLESRGYQWIAEPSTVVVKAGDFTPTRIKLVKIPKAP